MLFRHEEIIPQPVNEKLLPLYQKKGGNILWADNVWPAPAGVDNSRNFLKLSSFWYFGDPTWTWLWWTRKKGAAGLLVVIRTCSSVIWVLFLWLELVYPSIAPRSNSLKIMLVQVILIYILIFNLLYIIGCFSYLFIANVLDHHPG